MSASQQVFGSGPSESLRMHACWLYRALVLPWALWARCWARWLHSEAAFDGTAKLLSIVPGRPGLSLRAAYYSETLAACSPDVVIAFGSFFSHMGARVGRRVRIGSYCIIGTADIEEGASIDNRVSVLSGRHQHGGGERGAPSKEQPVRYECVRIGAEATIRAGAIVMADVGAQCVVEAGSTVTRCLVDGAHVAGNPARVIAPDSAPTERA